MPCSTRATGACQAGRPPEAGATRPEGRGCAGVHVPTICGVPDFEGQIRETQQNPPVLLPPPPLTVNRPGLAHDPQSANSATAGTICLDCIPLRIAHRPPSSTNQQWQAKGARAMERLRRRAHDASSAHPAIPRLPSRQRLGGISRMSLHRYRGRANRAGAISPWASPSWQFTSLGRRCGWRLTLLPGKPRSPAREGANASTGATPVIRSARFSPGGDRATNCQKMPFASHDGLQRRQPFRGR